MGRGAVVLLIGVVALGAIGTLPALAKGPSRAVIRGPGLDGPLVLTWRSHGSTDFSDLVQRSGIFDQLWCRHCGGSSDARPPGPLGPRFTVTYTLALELVRHRYVDHVVQDLYPFAGSHPVSFVHRGQPFWGSERAAGGWFTARPSLRGLLIELGIHRIASPEPVSAAARSTGEIPAGATSGVSRDGEAIVLVLAFVTIAWLAIRRVRVGRSPADRTIER